MRQPSGQYDCLLLYGKMHDSWSRVLTQRLFCRQILKFHVSNGVIYVSLKPALINCSLGDYVASERIESLI